MDDARIPTSEQLLAELGWVRRLARALVKDDTLADDLAQDTWLVAATHQPDGDRPLRPWLARVVTKLAHTRRRGEARRDARQLASGDDRAVPTPAELVERVELQHAVAAEVLALAEPYRSTVLLHFIEGLTSAEIARRLGVPDGTVRRRLKVALDQLRDALLERTDQPARGWLAALVPFARSPGPAPASAPLELFVMKKVIVALVLLMLLLAGGGVVWHRRTHTPPPTPTAWANPLLGAAKARGVEVSTAIPAWLSPPGVPPRRIAGRVMFHGVPVPDAKVRLGLEVAGEAMPMMFAPDEGPKLLQPIAEVIAAADGTFDFGVQPPLTFQVSASAPSFSAAVAAAVGQDPRTRSDQLVLELGDCRSHVYGTIADASGGAVAKARVVAVGLSGTESSPTGEYSLCLARRDGMGTPTANVHVYAEGYGAIRQDVIVEGAVHLDFKLVPEAVLVGRVTTRDGQPVAGARIAAVGNAASMRSASGWTTSERDGRFRITGLAPARFSLVASAAGVPSSAPIDVIARPAATSREISVVLASPGTVAQIRGHVLVAGAPVAGATVMALQDGKSVSGATSQTDGSFAFAAVPYGTTRFRVNAYRLEDPKALEIDRAIIDDIRLDVRKTASVRGHVTRHGRPVAGAHVAYTGEPQSTMQEPPPAAITDGSGAYLIEGVPAGAGQVVASDLVSRSFSDGRAVIVSAGDERTIDLDLTYAGEVQGTVVDQSGNVIPGVYVRMDMTTTPDMCEAMTDAKGQFTCSSLYGGIYVPTVAPQPGGRQGLAPANGHFEPIDVPSDGVVTMVTLVVANERLAIRGTVVDDTGASVPDVEVAALGRGRATMDPPSTMTDADGRFEIVDLARGTYTIQARVADGSEIEVNEIAAGGEPITVVLSRSGTIKGTLIGFSGSPDVFTYLHDPHGKLTRALVDGGQFTTVGLAPGRYTIEATSGVAVDAQAVDVHAGETVGVTLRDRGAGRVEGTMTDFATHAPLAGLRCDAKLMFPGQSFFAPPAPAQQAFTDAAGHYSVSAPIGRVRIFCLIHGGEPRSAAGGDVDVASAGPAMLNALSVREMPGPRGDAGFVVDRLLLPITVVSVLPNGPAAGLRPGDQLVSIDGASLQGLLPDGAMLLIANHRPGTTIALGISRGGETQTIKVQAVAAGSMPP